MLRSLSARWWVFVWVMSRQTAMKRTCGMFKKKTQQYTWTAPLEQLRFPDMLIIKRASMAPLSHLHGNSRGQGSGWHQVADRRNKKEREQDTETQIKTEREDFGSSYVCAWVLNQVCPVPQRKAKPVQSDQERECCHSVILFLFEALIALRVHYKIFSL